MRGIVAVVVGALLFAAPASAASQRVEAIGAVPAERGRPGAVRAGLEEAVRIVVRRLLSLPEDEALGNWRKLVGGGKARDYTIRYRVLDDLGERAALLIDAEASPREYVVVVEATIDRDALRAALVAQGAIAAPQAAPSTGPARARLVVEPVDGYPALAALEQRLEALGAGPVVPRSFSAGRAEYEIAVPGRPEALLDALRDRPPAGTRVRPIGASGGELRLQLESLAPLSAPLGTD